MVGLEAPSQLNAVFGGQTRERAMKWHRWIAELVMLALLAQAGIAKEAWWVSTVFSPEAKSVEGIALSDLDPGWVAASALREDMFPAEAHGRGESVADHGGQLAVSMDLDGDHRPEKALVGVYRDTAGVSGRFLLIIAKGRAGRQRKKALFTEPGSAGFSVLFQERTTLHWAFCMECDIGCVVVPDRGHWALDCESSEEE